MTANVLAEETSPYLLQHQDNPVHWRPWGPTALNAARAANKPVLLSIGYAACHWCHVMAHESFEDPETAALMNELFVSIKVDREERPDIDAIYQHALALLGQPGGWPLTMFLTPDGDPFWGGTYFPPTARFGRPGFPEVLRTVAKVFRDEPEKVTGNVTALHDALAQLSQPKTGDGITLQTTDEISRRLLQAIDPVHGGFGQAPKFPQSAIFELLWRAWKRTGEVSFQQAVTNTLTKMCLGGIYDHLGGGFARYSVDDRWLVPHFEKMLYDNAQLIEILTEVWQDARDPLYESAIRETVGWTLREMVAPAQEDGLAGFAASLDADSEGVEGKFYVWSEAEIDSVLGDDTALFKTVYDVSAAGNWEGHTVLNRTNHPARLDAAGEATLAACRDKLRAAREPRARPGWDDKVLADWNGLMIAALVKAGTVFDEPDWIAAARRAFAFVETHMTTADGRLHHSHRLGRLKHPASVDDYACLCRAALALFEATGEAAYCERAIAWLDILDRHYWDADSGGYFFSADDTETLIIRAKTAADNAVPAGNGVIVEVLARLYHLTGDNAYRTRADAVIAAFAGEVERNFFPLATMINANELLQQAVQVVLVGAGDDADMRALIGVVHDLSLPNRVLLQAAPGSDVPEGHPAAGKGQLDGQATAYVCEGMVCSLPLTDPADLRADLAARAPGGANSGQAGRVIR